MEMNIGILAILLLNSRNVFGLDNGLALTPPMGWMTWERYRCNIDCEEFPDECISERLIKKAADLVVSEGYAALGYKYIILDDCWLADERDSDGNLQPNKTRFPSGILELSKYVHSKGLKFGLYEDYGSKTCAGFPGILNNMEKDAKMFSFWEVDYVKLDGCYSDPAAMDQGYPAFQEFLNQTGRPMVYSCSWPTYQEEVGIKPNLSAIARTCNLWRNYDDIQDSWSSVKDIMDYFARSQNTISQFAGPGHWNDPDMLIIGNFGLSYDQSKSQMAIWCILAAPLIMSVDLESIRPEYKQILQNQRAIGINQDPLGIQGRLILVHNEINIWRRPLLPVEQGYFSYAIAYVSRRTDGTPTTVKTSLKDLGLYYPDGYTVQDVFSGEMLKIMISSDSKISVRVNPSGVVFLKFTVITSKKVLYQT